MDVSASNGLLYFKPTASTLDLATADARVLTELFGGKTVALARLFPGPAAHATAVRACKNLFKKQRDTTEELGVGCAFVALGMATWAARPDLPTPSDGGEGDRIGDEDEPAPRGRSGPQKPPNAPVLLRPLNIQPRRGAPGVFDLALDGETSLNPVLQHLLAAKGAVVLEEEVLELFDDLAAPLDAAFDLVRRQCTEVEGFAIAHERIAGAFAYLQRPMVVDVEDIDALMASDIVAALAGDDDALTTIRAHSDLVTTETPDRIPVSLEHLVINADSSQAFVVNAAVAGRNLVVQGPPGTGKSQTIANTIAALVAEGRSVLFVAQKRAAIEAVLANLTKVDLQDLVLDMFAASGSRTAAVQQIRAALDGRSQVPEPVTDRLHANLSAARDRLKSHRDAWHATEHGWAPSVHTALGYAYEAAPENRLSVRLPSRVVSAWTPQQLIDLEAAASELAALGGLRPDLHTAVGWSPSGLTSSAAHVAASDDLAELCSDASPRERSARRVVEHALGWELPHGVVERERALTLIRKAEVVPGSLVDPALQDDELIRMLAASSKDFRRRQGVDVGWWERRRLRAAAQALVNRPGATDEELYAVLRAARGLRRAWKDAGLPGRVVTADGARDALAVPGQQVGSTRPVVDAGEPPRKVWLVEGPTPPRRLSWPTLMRAPPSTADA